MRPKQLYLHTSNRIGSLAARLVEVAEETPLSGLLAQETVMTLNPGMARWLRFEIARHAGVSFGWEFPLPGKLFARLLAGFAPDHATNGAISEDLARWRLSEILENLEDEPRFALLRAYCEARSPTRRLSFASRLARMFDEYLVYRPETIVAWEDKPDPSDWQAELWRRLTRALFPGARRPRHIARLWSELRQRDPARLEVETSSWPQRLFLFGASSLAPLYLDILDAVSRFRPVHIFLLQPSDLYWADLKTTKQIQKIAARAARQRDSETIHPEDWLFETGNPLLPALGRQSQMFLDLLIDRDAIQDDADYFDPPDSATQLSALQSDLFTLESQDAAAGETTYPEFDGTIQIHACCSKRREVETLWDFLIERFDNAPSLRPSEILVMAPEIQSYRSHIDAVFGAHQDASLEIPYTIADASSASQSPVFSGLAALLKTPATRAGANEILALLETPLLREAFRFSDLDLERIEFWIREAGITWGWDADHREERDGFPTPRSSWRELQIRLGAGLAHGDDAETPSGFLALSEQEGDLSDTAGRFLECLQLARGLRESYAQKRSLAAWQAELFSLIAALRTPRDDWQEDLQRCADLVREALPEIGDLFASGAEAFQAILDKLEQSAPGSGYLSGGVTFCSLKPMRSIPANTVCLLGMNRADFPRRSVRLSFDLLGQSSRMGDRNTRDEDRQYFLETLLSVRSHLYISYQGLEPTSDSEKEPSSVVQELQAYLLRALGEAGFAKLRYRQKRQSCDVAYFAGERHFTYDPARAALRRRFDQTLAADDAPPPQPDSPPDAASTPELELETLARFLCDPARAFAQDVAQVRLAREQDPLAEIDALAQDPLDRYQLRQALAEAILRGEPLESLSRARFANRKLLPPGLLEAPTFESELERARIVADALGPDLPVISLARAAFADTLLVGYLPIAPSIGRQILVLPGEISAKRALEAWIQHLLATCALPAFSGETLVFSLRDLDKALRFEPVADSRARLAKLLEFYQRGQRAPLPFFPELSRSVFKSWISSPDPSDPLAIEGALAEARREIRKARESTSERRGFKWTAYDAFCFGDSFAPDESFLQVARAVWEPLEAALSQLAPT